MRTELKFKHSYNVNVIDHAYKNDLNVYYFQEKADNNNALTLSFQSEKINWIGVFDGIFSHNEFIGIYSCPNEYYCLILFSDIIYLVNTIEPGIYTTFFSPKDLIISTKYNQIILVLFNSLVSIGLSGVIWELKEISIDTISVSSKSEKDLSIKYFDLQNDLYVTKTINFETHIPVIT